jgi:hypothetical protein
MESNCHTSQLVFVINALAGFWSYSSKSRKIICVNHCNSQQPAKSMSECCDKNRSNKEIFSFNPIPPE